MTAAGQYNNQAALAVGYSCLSDNGKYGVKLSLGANTQGEVSSGRRCLLLVNLYNITTTNNPR